MTAITWVEPAAALAVLIGCLILIAAVLDLRDI